MGIKVFVTRELFPFTAGGIGRVVANMLLTAGEEERKSMAVLYVGDNVDEGAFSQAFPGVAFLAWPHHRYRGIDANGNWYPPQAAFTHSYLHWESVHVLQGLEEFERAHGAPAYVEFIDWGAAAFAATQRRKMGNGLQETLLAVRLHTTDSILADFEPRPQDVARLALFDLERKALADCDIIVGQLPPVAEAFRRFYGFSAEDWNDRLRQHAPPVLLDTRPLATRVHPLADDTPLLFTSKLQDIKRPDVFIRGCVQFMRERPEFKGEAVFLAHSFDPSYQAYITNLIPDDLVKRVVFARGISGAAREKRIAESVCIFPSPWESFCLAAYEAGLSGAICVLNSANPAFGPGTPWLDGVNCGTFDGTAESLTSALHRLYDAVPAALSPVVVPNDPLPWNDLPKARQALPTAPRVSLSVVIANCDSGTGLLRTLDSILVGGSAIQRIVIVDDASTDPRDVRTLQELPVDDRLVVRRLEVPVGIANARNIGLDLVEDGLVAFVRAGDRFAPSFLEDAAQALHVQPGYDVVVGQTVLSDYVDLPPSDLSGLHAVEIHPSRFHIYYGEARLSGLYENRFAPDSFMIRTAVARHNRFSPVMPAVDVWEQMLRVCQGGSRFLVAPEIVATSSLGPGYSRQDGPIDPYLEAARRRLQGKRATLGTLDVPAYFAMTMGGSPLVNADVAETSARLQELLDSETVRYTLALSNLLQRRAPWVLRGGKWLARRLHPLYRRFR